MSLVLQWEPSPKPPSTHLDHAPLLLVLASVWGLVQVCALLQVQCQGSHGAGGVGSHSSWVRVGSNIG